MDSTKDPERNLHDVFDASLDELDERVRQLGPIEFIFPGEHPTASREKEPIKTPGSIEFISSPFDHAERSRTLVRISRDVPPVDREKEALRLAGDTIEIETVVHTDRHGTPVYERDYLVGYVDGVNAARHEQSQREQAMNMSKCDECQRTYPSKSEHICRPMHYKQVLPGGRVDLSYTAMLDAVGKAGTADVYYLYVNPDNVQYARSVAKHLVNLCCFWVNVLPRPGLRISEWVVAANGEFIGSEGVS